MAVEEPKFTSVLKTGDFELRDYPRTIAAEVVVPGHQDAASSAGFRILANYIFGGNTGRQTIGMTAPVVQVPASHETIAMTAPVIQSGSPEGWTIRFFMPSGYTLESLPVPDDPQVNLKAVPPRRLAVVRFSGLARAGDVADRTTGLKAFVAQQGLTAIGPATLARYDPPWTLWFMRRNEIMIEVASGTRAGENSHD